VTIGTSSARALPQTAASIMQAANDAASVFHLIAIGFLLNADFRQTRRTPRLRARGHRLHTTLQTPSTTSCHGHRAPGLAPGERRVARARDAPLPA
jgi:hypothetical protein